MKKLLSLFLACLMIMSSFGIIGYAEEEGSILDNVLAPIDFTSVIVPSDESQFNNFKYTKTSVNAYGDAIVDYTGTIASGNSDTGYTDFEVLIPDGVINDANLFGLSVKDLYYTNGAVDWNNIRYIVKEDEIETVINDYSNFTLAKAYTNRYLTEKFVARFGSQGSIDLFTRDNFITITNFIGNLVNPNFVNLTPDSVNVAYTSDKDFYTGVVTLSGLRDLIANNWCNSQTLNYKVLLTLLGFDYNDEDMLGDSKIYNADRVSRTLVRSVIKRIIQQGPVDYLLNVIGKVSATYAVYAPAIKALFSAQVAAGTVTENELNSLDGVFNLIINGNNPKDTDKLQLLTLPIDKIKSTSDGNTVDTTSLFMILILYFNMVGRWTSGSRTYTYYDSASNRVITENVAVNNPAVVNNLISNSTDIGITYIYKAFFQADFSGYLNLISDESIEHMEEVKHPGASVGSFLKDYFASILKFFADIFAKIYNSFTHFGEF